MFLKIFVFLGAVNFIVSCTSQPQESKEAVPSAETSSVGCYRYINNKDTVILKTRYEDGYVTGTLVYNFYEKDKNTGTIQGQMKGKLLIADYSFFSEGVKSVRQVAFKKNDKTFVEGYGETEDKNGKAIFKNVDSIDFSHSTVLTEFPCEK